MAFLLRIYATKHFCYICFILHIFSRYSVLIRFIFFLMAYVMRDTYCTSFRVKFVGRFLLNTSDTNTLDLDKQSDPIIFLLLHLAKLIQLSLITTRAGM